MSKILVVKTKSQYNALNVFEDELIRNWKNMKAEVDCLSVSYKKEDLIRAGASGYDFVFTMNGGLFENWNEEELKGYLNAPIFSYYVDHPLHHDYRLRKSAEQHCILVDKDFGSYIDKHYSYDNTIIMQAGVEGANSSRKYKDRKYPVVFCGSYIDCRKILEDIKKEDESIREIQLKMIEDGLKNPSLNMEQIFNHALNVVGHKFNNDYEYTNYLGKCSNVEIYLRGYYRQNVIKKLIENGISVEVFGNGWENLEATNEKLLNCHDAVDYEKMLDVFVEAQIVINVMPWTKSGFHDRVACGMLNGALVVTDETSYMKDQQLNGSKLITYSLANLDELSNKIDYYMQNLEEAEKIAREGYLWAKENHTWENRAQKFMRIFRNETETAVREDDLNGELISLSMSEELAETLKLWEQYMSVLVKIEKLDCRQIDKDFLLDFLSQMEELTQYTIQQKQVYCNGGGMFWIEKYMIKILSNIWKLVEDNNYDNLSALFREASECVKRNIAQINEMLSYGLYNVDLGKMQYKDDIDINKLSSVWDLAKAIEPQSMNDLEQFFFLEKHNKMTKWGHYFEVYDRHFNQFRNKPITLLEIGVWGGGSLQMWKKYFGPECTIIGIDIMEECKSYEEDRIDIYIGSQEDKDFLKRLKEQIPKPDIIIDDGGHTMNQQIVTFEEMFPFLEEGGIYLCEDVHTSYWPDFGGEYKKRDTFIEYSKNFVDRIHARYTTSPELQPDDFTKTVRAVHYYDSMIVLEKGTHKPTMPFWI